MKVRVHPEARVEFKEAALYYGQIEEGLGVRFVEAVDLAIQSIQELRSDGQSWLTTSIADWSGCSPTRFCIPSRLDPSSLLPSCIPIGSPSIGSPDLQTR